MKKILIALICAFLFGALSSQAAAQTLLNEISVNPPGTDNPCEYAELRGAPGATLTNLYFVSVEGDAGAATGTADMVVNLSSQTLGANGLLVIISPTPCPGRTYPAQTTQVTDPQLDTSGGGIENGTVSQLLIQSATPIIEGTDYDADNNGTLELLPAGATIVDAIGWSDGGTGDIVYGGVNLILASGAPDAASRFINNNTANSAAAWFYGDLAGTDPNSTAYNLSSVSANFPLGGALTPGSPNVVVPRKAPVDFNGDGRSDYVVIRNSGGQRFWYVAINGATELRGAQWGLQTDIPVPADYDGDNRTDFAVWRPAAAEVAAFYILQSSNNTVRSERFGQAGDNPTVVGDYDGDGRADLAVFRSTTTAFWYYRPSGTPATQFVGIQWGTQSDIPAPGDYDGDGRYDFNVFRAGTNGAGTFYLRLATGAIEAAQWGSGTDIVVPGDYDGDGRFDFAVSRTIGNNYQFYILTRAGATQFYAYGQTGDVRAPGDYNGDGRTDIAVWRATTGQPGNFFVRPSGTTGAADTSLQWGFAGDYPAANFVTQ